MTPKTGGVYEVLSPSVAKPDLLLSGWCPHHQDLHPLASVSFQADNTAQKTTALSKAIPPGKVPSSSSSSPLVSEVILV